MTSPLSRGWSGVQWFPAAVSEHGPMRPGGRGPTLLRMAVADPDVRDVILRDGGTLRLRPPRAADVDALLGFFGGLSERERLPAVPRLPVARPRDRRAVRRARLGRARSADRHASGDEDGERVVALANYVRLRDPARAEVAFAVADELQGHGVGTRLLEQLAEPARRRRDRDLRRRGDAGQRADAGRLRATPASPSRGGSRAATTEVRLEIAPTEPTGRRSTSATTSRSPPRSRRSSRRGPSPSSARRRGAARSAASSSATSSTAASTASPTRSTRRRAPVAGVEATRRSRTSPTPSTWPSSASPASTCLTRPRRRCRRGRARSA